VDKSEDGGDSFNFAMAADVDGSADKPHLAKKSDRSTFAT
jgi:hypothetical protein